MIQLFADESGNTGPQLFTPEQPILVVAIVRLDSAQIARLSVVPADANWTEPGELKFTRLSRDPAGLKVLKRLCESMDVMRVAVRFLLTEKLYFAASFVTETFLDGAYNPYMPPVGAFTGAMRWETNRIYEACDPSLLQAFVEAARVGDSPRIQELGRSVVGRLKFHPDDRVLKMARVLELGLPTPFDWSELPEGLKFPNPITRPYSRLLAIIDADIASDAEVISDEDQQFGRVLDEIVTRCRKPENFPGGTSPYGVPGPLKKILRRTAVDSTNSFGVQLADICAGLIRHITASVWHGREPSSGLLEVWESFLKLIPVEAGYWEASESFFRKLLHPFRGQMRLIRSRGRFVLLRCRGRRRSSPRVAARLCGHCGWRGARGEG